MTAPPGWGSATGRRADLDQVIAGLPARELQQLSGLAERIALQHVAGAAGTETIWGVASCRTVGGSGVMALTDGRILVCLLNAQQQPWVASVALDDAILEFEEGGRGQSGCPATLTYGSTALGLFVGRDADYAVAFLNMVWEQTGEDEDTAEDTADEETVDEDAVDEETVDEDADEAFGASDADLAAVRALLAVIESEVASGEVSRRQVQRLAEPLLRAGLLDSADPAADPAADAAVEAAVLRRALNALGERLGAGAA
jgi:hypothetical protein